MDRMEANEVGREESHVEESNDTPKDVDSAEKEDWEESDFDRKEARENRSQKNRSKKAVPVHGVPYKRSILELCLDDVRRYPLLPHEMTVSLARRIRDKGDLEARNLLVAHNMRLAIVVAYRNRGRGLELLDLVQEAALGLMEAADRFDPELGFQFSTYAFYWIRQKVQRAIHDQGQTIRKPVHVQERWGRVARTSREFFQEYGRHAGADELASALSMSVEEIGRVVQDMKVAESVSLDELREVGKYGDSVDLHEVVASHTELGPLLSIAAKETLEEACEGINVILTKLNHRPAREQTIFLTRYGLDDGTLEKKTLELLGDLFALTRERVRQILEGLWEDLHNQGIPHNERWLRRELNRILDLEDLSGISARQFLPASGGAQERQATGEEKMEVRLELELLERRMRPILEVIERLPERDKTPFLMRYGLDGSFGPTTIRKIAQALSLRPSEVEQGLKAAWRYL